MQSLNISDLGFSGKARICWGFFWRGIVISVGSVLCGAVLGGIAGFILGMLSFPRETITVVGGILGLMSGVFFLYIYIRWLLSSRIGKFRFSLIYADAQV